MKRIMVLCFLVSGALAQEKKVPKVVPVPVPKVPMEAPGVQEPADPPSREVSDARARLSLRLPAGWNLERRDGELSTFRLDARTAPARTELRVVANMSWNPFPRSTFSGAWFYLSVTPGTTAAGCAAQTSGKPGRPIAPATIDDVRFKRGRDEHGKICTESRDVSYTTFRRGSCVRFDLAVNTFCGGEVSGAEDITDVQLGDVFGRMEGILQTVKFVRP